MEIKIKNNKMNDLVNYGFKSFDNGGLKLPIKIKNNEKFLISFKDGKIPILKITSDNSVNSIEFYVISVNSETKLTFNDLRLKTNYYIFNDNKYKFS